MQWIFDASWNPELRINLLIRPVPNFLDEMLWDAVAEVFPLFMKGCFDRAPKLVASDRESNPFGMILEAVVGRIE